MNRICIIYTTNGASVFVDPDDYDRFSQCNWYFNFSIGYAMRRVKEGKKLKTVYMHREIMKPPVGMEVDHINGIRHDNRKSNLRICTKKQNLQNKLGRKNHSSKYKGVVLATGNRKQKWAANIRIDGKKFQIGCFKEERHAAMAYDIWAKDVFGEFASTNFISVN